MDNDTEGSKENKDEDIGREAKNTLWNLFFNINKMKKGKSKYRFAHHIVTDGISVGVLQEPHGFEKKHKMARKSNIHHQTITSASNSATSIPQLSPNDLEGKTIVGVDPGKHLIVYMTTNGKKKLPEGEGRLQYTNCQRFVESGAKRFSKIREQMKKKKSIEQYENILSETNS